MKPPQHDLVERVSPRCSTNPVCTCGQDLDFVHGTHCPRCGTTLRVRPALAPAA